MNELISIPDKNGTVMVPKFSRIKIYHKFTGIINGYLIGSDNEKLYLIVPYYPNRFDKGIVEGKEESIYKRHLIAFSFYPEVTILETSNSIDRKEVSKNDD